MQLTDSGLAFSPSDLNHFVECEHLTTLDLRALECSEGYLTVTLRGADVYDPTTGQIRSDSTDDVACWFIDTDYNGESFFVRHAYFTGADEPCEKLKRGLRAEIDEAAWRGDGAGYDIASFNDDGSRRFIEVKTTGLGKAFPFYVSANEVRCSEALEDAFHLYRVFRFSRTPGLFILPGALSATCALDAVQYQAKFA